MMVCAWVWEAQGPGPWQPLWAGSSPSQPPCSPGQAEGENRAGPLPLPPVPGASCLGHGTGELASVLGWPLGPHRAVLPERWAFGEVLREPLIPSSPQALTPWIQPCLRTKAGGGTGASLLPSQPSSPLPQRGQKAGRAPQGRARAACAWTREDGTHVDSRASGGIWGSRGAGVPTRFMQHSE